MKLRLSILLLAAAALAACPAAGQTIKSLGYNTTNGNIVAATNVTFTNSVGFATNARAATRTNLGGTTLGNAVFTATNTAAAQVAIFGTNAEINTSGGLVGLTLSTNETKLLNPISFPFLGGATAAATTLTNLGLGATNTVTFSNIQLGIFGAGGDTGFVGRNSGGLFALYGTNVSSSVPAFYGWSGSANTAFSAATARTNLELGATNNVTFSNVTANGTLAVSNTATFATNVSIAGSLSVGSLTTTTPSTWALDATQTAAATNGVLTLPSNANVIRLTNNNAISSVTNGVLGAFYYLVNQATNAVTISNVGGITIDGAQNLTLSPNESATLVATGATNVSVANRGDLTDVALGGTANTAPSQTASSGSSLMTRDLVDNNPLLSLGSVRTLGPYATNNSGTASSTSVIGFNSSQLVSGTATNGYARASLMSALNLNPATGNGINLSQSIVVGMTFATINTSAENAIRLVVGGNGAVPAPANSNALTGRGFGVEITRDGVTAGEANLRLFSHDGTNYTTSSFSTNFTMTSARQMQLLLSKGTNGVIQLFFSHAAASKAPSRPSTTPLLTLSNGPSGTAVGAFIDLVTVNNSTSAPVNANTLYFYNGMVEVKD